MQGESVGSVSCAAPQARGLRLPWQTGVPTLGCWGATAAATGRAARPAAGRFGVLLAGMALGISLAGRWGRGTGEGLGPRKPESGCPEGHSPTPEATWGAGFLSRLQTLASGASMRPGREEGEGPSWLVGSGDVLRPPFPHGPVPPLPLASVGNSVHRGPDAGVELAKRESG